MGGRADMTSKHSVNYLVMSVNISVDRENNIIGPLVM